MINKRSFLDRSSLKVLISIVLIIALLSVLFVSARTGFPSVYYDGFAHNVLIFLFVNLNLVLLCVLMFVVGRNVVRLLFEWKNNILGSKLRVKLVCLLVGLVLVPTVLLFILASSLFTSAMEGWLGGEARETRMAALTVAREHYATVEDSTVRHLEGLAQQLPTTSAREVKSVITHYRRIAGMVVVALFRGPSDEIAISVAPQRGEYARQQLRSADPGLINRTLLGEKIIIAGDEKRGGELVKVYVPAKLEGKPVVLVGITIFPAKVITAFHHISEAFQDYEQLRLFRSPIRSGYLLTFTMVSGMILFSALWVAFYLARQIVGPIEALANATSQVAKGDYSIRIDSRGDDELSYLVLSFNTMVADLRNSRADAEARRLLIEVILRHLAVGVVSVDRERNITLMNPAARALFGIDVDPVGVKLAGIVPPECDESIDSIFEEGEATLLSEVVNQDLRLSRQGRELEIVMTTSPMYGPDKNLIGAVLLFDDVTELTQAQQMAAWREVARRIAHEIKNPLTPLQLSAQRISKLLPNSEEFRSLRESADTIVEHVGSIQRLANEFSRFARMPTADRRLADLNVVVSDVLEGYAADVTRITFQGITDPRLPEFYFDSEQLRRVLINLLDNAADALRDFESGDEHFQPRIAVNTKFDRKRRRVVLEVIDNGPGVPADKKGRVFDPYFSGKKGGTGLGLAIVTTIVADHQGRIRLYDNRPHGVRFVIELPLEPRGMRPREAD